MVSCVKEKLVESKGVYKTNCTFEMYKNNHTVTSTQKGVEIIISEDSINKFFIAHPRFYEELDEPIKLIKDNLVFSQNVESLYVDDTNADRLEMTINTKEQILEFRYIGLSKKLLNDNTSNLDTFYMLVCSGKKVF